MQLKGLVNFKWENFLLIIIFVRRLYDQQNFVMHKHGKLQIRSTGCLLRGVKYEFGLLKETQKSGVVRLVRGAYSCMKMWSEEREEN